MITALNGYYLQAIFTYGFETVVESRSHLLYDDVSKLLGKIILSISNIIKRYYSINKGFRM